MIKPGRLKANDCLGIVAPAGVVDPDQLAQGIRRIEQLGFKVVSGKYLHKKQGYLAGRDKERAEDLLGFFSDPKIDAIICARGGYGSTRVIPYLEPELIRKNPKIFLGSSDITALLLYLQRQCGLVCFHGPMAAPNFGRHPSALTEKYFRKTLGSNLPLGELTFPGLEILKKGEAEGILVGGCLSLLCASMGTVYELETENKILFLEDVNEAPYRLDRMLLQLREAGKLDKVAGIIFGQMYNCFPSDKRYSLEEIVLDLLSGINCPIIQGFPSGHGPDNITLPLGVNTCLRAGDSSPRIIIKEAGVI